MSMQLSALQGTVTHAGLTTYVNTLTAVGQASSHLCVSVLCWTGMHQARLLYGGSIANSQRVLLQLASSFDYKNIYKQL